MLQWISVIGLLSATGPVRADYDLVLKKGWLTKERLDDLLKPENMTHPRQVS